MWQVLHELRLNNRDSLLRYAEASGQSISLVMFDAAAQALTGYMLCNQRQDPTHNVGEEERKESYHYLNRVIRYSSNVLDCLQVMYIFKTTTGQFRCSPKRPSAGDVLVAVPGGKFLHIISQDMSRYIGAASVHGLMGATLLERVQELDDSVEEITLFTLRSLIKMSGCGS